MKKEQDPNGCTTYEEIAVRAKRLGRGLGSLLNRTDEQATADRAGTRGVAQPDTRVSGGAPAAMPPAGALERGGASSAGTAPPVAAREDGNEPGAPESVVRGIAIASIRPNPFQPRTAFGEGGLEELQASIAEHGVLQPIVVRSGGAGGYEVVAGERRLRASRNLGLETIPALVRSATDEDMQTLALVENLQREDLNAMEKARALRAMMRNLMLTQEDVASRVGKARTTIANLLRLLDLPEEIQAWVEEGRLTGAHARALLQAQGAQRRLDLARQAMAKGWSVREVERRAKAGPTVGKRRTRSEDPYVRDLEDRLRRALSTDVRLMPKGKGGRIEIRYHDADELDGLLELLQV